MAMFEQLESRRLMSTVSYSRGVLTVEGGSGNDLITVSEDQGEVHVEYYTNSGEFRTRDFDCVRAINIIGGKGDDAIYYTGNSIGAKIEGDGSTSGRNDDDCRDDDRRDRRDCDYRNGRDHRKIKWHGDIHDKFRCYGSKFFSYFFGNWCKPVARDGNDAITVADEGCGTTIVDGNGGDDAITIMIGNSTKVYGGDGNDAIYLNTGVGVYDLTNSKTIVYAEDGADIITTYAGKNYIYGGDGKDTVLDFGGHNIINSATVVSI